MKNKKKDKKNKLLLFTHHLQQIQNHMIGLIDLDRI